MGKEKKERKEEGTGETREEKGIWDIWDMGATSTELCALDRTYIIYAKGQYLLCNSYFIALQWSFPPTMKL